MIHASTNSAENPDPSLLQQRVNELEGELALFTEVSSSLATLWPPRTVLQALIDLAQRFIPADACAIWRRNEDGAWLRVMSGGVSDQFIPNGAEGIAVPAEPVFIEDIERDAIHNGWRASLRGRDVRSMIVIPLRIEGEASALIVFCWRDRRAFSTAEKGRAVTFATIAGTALSASEIVDRRNAELDLVNHSIPVLISYVDTHQRFRRVNKAYERFFGLSNSEIVGKTVAEIVGPEHFAIAEPHLERALNGEYQSFRSRVRRPDGTLRDIELTYVPDFGFGGTVRGIVVAVNDITHYRQVGEAQARLAAIVDSADDAIVSKTLDGVITSWNHGAERMYGYTAAEAVGQSITLIIPEERRPEEDEVLARLRRGEKVDHFETERRAKDGRRLDVSLTISPVKDREGNIIGASKIGRDITEKKRAEAERLALLLREKRARETAELLNRVGPVLAAELDPQSLTQKVTDLATQAVHAEFGAFFYNMVNDAGEAYMLYTLSGASRESFEKLPMPPNTDLFSAAFRGEGVVRCDDVQKDPRYGQLSPFHGMPQVHSYLAVPVISRVGKVLGGLFFGHAAPGIFTEESERIVAGIAAQAAIALDNAELFSEAQRSHDALRNSNEELKSVNDDLSQFAHSASHDLQEPLRSVSIYSQLLRRKLSDKLDAEGEQYIKFVLKGASRMERLLKDLLEYTQASSRSGEPVPVIEATRALKTALSNLNAAIERSGAQIIHGTLPRVQIREIHLTQVFQNLIGNAIKYRSERPPVIKIAAEQLQDKWQFSVDDNGIGIDEKYKEQIFGIFKRLHTADEYSGTGIGLAICQRIIERAGGRIWVQSEPGRGSTFFFTLSSGT